MGKYSGLDEMDRRAKLAEESRRADELRRLPESPERRRAQRLTDVLVVAVVVVLALGALLTWLVDQAVR